MKRLLMATAMLGMAGACAPVVPDSGTEEVPARYGMPPEEATAIVYDVIAQAGCTITFDDFQSELDARGYSAALADPTTEDGQLTLANRFILESAILDMAKADLLERSSWTFTSNTGACA